MKAIKIITQGTYGSPETPPLNNGIYVVFDIRPLD